MDNTKKDLARKIMRDIMNGDYKNRNRGYDYYRQDPIPTSETFRRLKVDGVIRATKLS